MCLYNSLLGWKCFLHFLSLWFSPHSHSDVLLYSLILILGTRWIYFVSSFFIESNVYHINVITYTHTLFYLTWLATLCLASFSFFWQSQSRLSRLMINDLSLSNVCMCGGYRVQRTNRWPLSPALWNFTLVSRNRFIFISSTKEIVVGCGATFFHNIAVAKHRSKKK